MHVTWFRCPLRVATAFQLATAQSLILCVVFAPDPLANKSPSGLNATGAIPKSVAISLRVATPHNLTLSLVPPAKSCPSGLKAKAMTLRRCPLRVAKIFLSATDHKLMIPFFAPLANKPPSGLNARESTLARSLSVSISSPWVTDQSLMTPSHDPLASNPVGTKGN